LGQLIPWIQVTIAGFVYIASAFFVILKLVNKKNLQFVHVKEYLPYLAILVVFLSYAVGYSAHLVSKTCIIDEFYSEYKLTQDKSRKLTELKENREELYQSLNDNYSNLVMFRHLFVATILLGISLFIWFYKHEKRKLKWIALITCIVFAAVFFIAWRSMNQIISNFESVHL
jgi:hypothetical protein